MLRDPGIQLFSEISVYACMDIYHSLLHCPYFTVSIIVILSSKLATSSWLTFQLSIPQELLWSVFQLLGITAMQRPSCEAPCVD